MDDKLRDAYFQVFVGEAKAALRLKVFAERAEQDGYPQMAKLFRAVARSEEIHGTRALRALREIKSTEDNLAESFEKEEQVAQLAYNQFIKLANELGDKTAALTFSQDRDAEEGHAKLYKEAMTHMMEERETTYHICKVCGYVSDGVLPDECPICQAKKEYFEKM